jgi:hypothetical protein
VKSHGFTIVRPQFISSSPYADFRTERSQYGSVSAKSLILPSAPTPLSCRCLDAHKREETSRSMRRFFIRGKSPNKNAAPKLGREEPELQVRARGFDRKRRVCEGDLVSYLRPQILDEQSDKSYFTPQL